MSDISSSATRLGALLLRGALIPLAFLAMLDGRPSQAQSLTIDPPNPVNDNDSTLDHHGITWDIVGLDSNNVIVGPDSYLVAARVVNANGFPDAFNATASVSNPFCPGSGSGTGCDLHVGGSPCIQFVNQTTGLALGTIPGNGKPVDFFFNVQLLRNASCQVTGNGGANRVYLPYVITVTACSVTTSPCPAGSTITISTTSTHQILEDVLVSQNRNSVIDVSGPTTVFVGDNVTYTLDAQTSTGYTSHETFIPFPNHIFRMGQAGQTTGGISGNGDRLTGCYQTPATTGGCAGTNSLNAFTNGFPTNQVWANACNIDQNPLSANYTQCIGLTKTPFIPPNLMPAATSNDVAGNKTQHKFNVDVVACVTGATPAVNCIGTPTIVNNTLVLLSPLVYDGSGSSYHYNSDFVTATCTAPGFLPPGCNHGSVPCKAACVQVSAPPTSVKLRSAKASLQDDGTVLLEWRTGRESRILGYRVYRDEFGVKTPITPSLVAGSALVSAPETPFKAGNSYRWLDPAAPAHYGALYWIESIGTKGEREWHGPYEAQRVRGVEEAPTSPLLANLAHAALAPAARTEVLGPVAPAQEEQALRPFASRSPFASTSSAQTQQFSIAAMPAAKLSVNHAGWYRVGQSALAAIGFATGSDPRKLQLFVDGAQQPISVAGEADGVFNPGDSVGFYGTGLDTPTTDTHVYYLVNGSTKGTRISKIGPGKTLSPLPATSFPFAVQSKDRLVFFSDLQNGDADSFFGEVIYDTVTDLPLSLTHVDPAASSSSTLEVSLQGITEDTGSFPDHTVTVAVNGTPVGTMGFNGRELATQQFPVPGSALVEGGNVVTLTAGGPSDYSLVNNVKLTYWHTYTADGGSLAFTAAGGYRTTVTGFPSGAIRVFDVTSPSSPQEVTASATASGGLYNATFNVPGTGTRSLLAVEDSAVNTPSAVKLNQPSSLNAKSNAADLVIIGYGSSFLSAATDLVHLRTANGYRVAAVDVEDVYDEFSYGAHDSAAIRSFMSWAKANWSSPPKNLLLLGDASFDPRNYLGFGNLDLVPTRLVLTKFLKTASDDWFTDFNGDGVADIPTGRLPARNPAEVTTMVGKIVGYQSASSGAWSSSALFVADADDQQGNDFPSASDAVVSLLPGSLTKDKIYVDTLGVSGARTELLNQFNTGALFLNYLGHGSVEIWTLDPIFDINDAYALTNGSQLPFVVALTCLSGLFQDVYTESMAEALLRAPNGGAVAVWASSTLSYLQGQAPADQELARQLFGTTPTTIGQAVLKAKLATPDADVRKSWNLFGDPTMKLRYP
jgi:hypothetical protein